MPLQSSTVFLHWSLPKSPMQSLSLVVFLYWSTCVIARLDTKWDLQALDSACISAIISSAPIATPVHLSVNIIAWFIVLHISSPSMIAAVSCMLYAVPTGSIWKVPFGGYFTINRNWISRSIHAAGAWHHASIAGTLRLLHCIAKSWCNRW